MKTNTKKSTGKIKRQFKMVAVDASTKDMIDTICEKYKTKQYAIMDEALLLVLDKYPI